MRIKKLLLIFLLLCLNLKAQVPKNLNESFDILQKQLPERYRDSIKKLDENYFVASSHFGLGFNIRGYWGLNQGENELSEYFNKLGVTVPDNMSGIILRSYHRFLNNKDVDLNQQIATLNNSKLASKKPLKSTYPKGAENLDLNMTVDYPKSNSTFGKVFIGKVSSNKYWLYDYYYGWMKLTKKEFESFYATYDDEKEKKLIEFSKRK